MYTVYKMYITYIIVYKQNITPHEIAPTMNAEAYLILKRC